MATSLKSKAKRNRTLQLGKGEGQHVGTAELAKMCGVTRKTIMTWLDQGLPYLAGGGKAAYLFDSAECMRWRMQTETDKLWKIIDKGDRPDDDPVKMSIDEAKRRREVALALGAEVALAKEQEKLADIDYLMGEFRNALVNVRADLISLPARTAATISNRDVKFITKTLTNVVTKTLTHLSEYD